MSTPHTAHLVVVGTTGAAHTTAVELQADGYAVRHATTAGAASLLLSRGPLDAALLYDLADAPRAVEIARAVRDDAMDHRAADRDVPLLVGDCDGELDQLRAFDAGADDALPSGLSHLVLRAHIDALLRRSRLTTPARDVARVAGLTIDAAAQTVTFGHQPVPFTPTGFRFVSHLAEDPRRLFTTEELLRSVWGFAAPGRTRVVATCASRVRASLSTVGATGLVVARRGCGYALLPPLTT